MYLPTGHNCACIVHCIV